MNVSNSPRPRRPFGRTGLLVDPICIGTAPIGHTNNTYGYSVDEERGLATARAIFAGPFNFVDTAAFYGDGRAERFLGTALREIGGLPPGFVLSTKLGRNPSGEEGFLDADGVRRVFERSQRLLGMERIPIVFLHDPRFATFESIMGSGGAFEGLARLRDEDLIGHLGVGEGDVAVTLRYVETGEFEAILTHNRYTLLGREAEPLIQAAWSRGLAVMNGAPYGSGILAKGPDAAPRYQYQPASAAVLEKARRLETICRRHSVPLAAAALQFSLRDPLIACTDIGVSRPERIQQTLELAQWPIPAALWEEVAAVE
jgi:D-threo-aldose 1-dehydrogenase